MVESLEGVRSTADRIPRTPAKVVKPWLNLVFDLNGILCVCEEFRSRSRDQAFIACTLPHSSTVPAKVGPKLVYVRPGCKAFLGAVSKFATVSVWSSMKLNTATSIAKFLFPDTASPKIILGQEHCRKIVTAITENVPQYLKVKNSDKEVFLKTLSTDVFPKYNSVFTKENTIIIDDSPYKHVLNDPQNVVLLDTWSYKGDGWNDTFLLNVLLPWLQRLHNSAELGLRSFRRENRLGRPTLCSDPLGLEYRELTQAIMISNGLRGV